MKEEDEQAATKQQQVSKHLRAAAHHLFYYKNWNKNTLSSILADTDMWWQLQQLIVVNLVLPGEYSTV